MIAREEARLRAMFRRLLLLSASAATSALACSSPLPANSASGDSGAAPPAGDAGDAGSGIDATIGSDGATPSEAGAGGDGSNPYGFSDAACDPVLLDAGADDGGCDFLERLPCGIPPGTPTENCYLAEVDCAKLCGQALSFQTPCAISECLAVDGSVIPSTTPLTLECATLAAGCGPGAGRRPQGLVAASPARHRDAIGSVLAVQARLEAASAHAFRQLGAELAAMGAPRPLVRAAERSARDEVRHARVMSRLARRRGAVPAPVKITSRRSVRSLEAFAIENAVEGCVRECFGALVATRQASHATDPELAREMERIARDETRHAGLAWEVARWVEPRLTRTERANVRRAMGEALGALRREVERAPAATALALGLPAGDAGTALVNAFEAALLS